MNQQNTAANGQSANAENTAPLDRLVSITAHVRDNKPRRAVKLRDALTGKAFPQQAFDLARKIRNTPDKASRSELKKQLPGYLPAGIFSGGKKPENLTDYTRLIAFDFDGIEDVDAAFQILAESPYSYFVGRSASGRGLVAIIQVDTPSDKHKLAWKAGSDYFATLGLEADPQAKDLNRGRFFSPDPDAHFNEAAQTFPASDAVEKAEAEAERKRAELQERRQRKAAARAAFGGQANIPEAAVDAIKSATNMEALAHYLGLEPAVGRQHGQYHCFNHAAHKNGDKNPSFRIFDSDFPGYKCFGCGIHGDPINLVQELTGKNFTDALEYLAQFNGCKHVFDKARETKQKKTKPKPKVKPKLSIHKHISEVTDKLVQEIKANSKLVLRAPTGAGKTRALIEKIAPLLDGNTLILVPTRTLAKQLGEKYGIPVAEGACDTEDLMACVGAKVAISTYDKAKQLGDHFTNIVIDEAHKLPECENYRGPAIQSLTRVMTDAKRVVLISATPPELYYELGFKPCEILYKSPTKILLYHISTKETKEATANELAAQLTENPNRLIIIYRNSLDGCDNMAEILQLRGINARAIHRRNADDNKFLDELIEGKPVTDAVQVVVTTELIETGFSIYAPNRDVSMIWIPDKYEPKSLVQFSGRVRDCNSIEVYAITNAKRQTVDKRPDAKALFNWSVDLWKPAVEVINRSGRFIRDAMSGHSKEHNLPSTQNKDSQAQNALFFSDLNYAYMNVAYLMAIAESKARIGISDADFFAEVQRLDPRFNVQQIAEPDPKAVATTAVELQQQANVTKAEQQALSQWIAGMLPTMFVAILQIAARSTHSNELKQRLLNIFSIDAKDLNADGSALMQDATQAGHNRLKLKELAQEFAQFAQTFARYGMRETEFVKILAPGDQLAKKESLEKLKRMLQKQASLVRPDRWESTLEVYDKCSYRNIVSKVQVGETYRSEELTEIVNAAQLENQQSPPHEAVRKVGELFEIVDVRTRIGGRQRRLKKIVRRRTFDTLAAEYGFDAETVKAAMCGQAESVPKANSDTVRRDSLCHFSHLSFKERRRSGTLSTPLPDTEPADSEPPIPPPF